MDARWLDDLRALLRDRQVDLGVALRLVIDQITRDFGADRGTLYLVDHARGEVVSRVAHLPEIEEIRLRIGEGLAGWVAREGRIVNVPRTSVDPRHTSRIDASTGYRTTTAVAVPVRDGGAVIAVLQLLNKPGGFSVDDEVRLAALADGVGALLDVTSLKSQLVPGGQHPLAFQFNHIVGQSPKMLAAYSLVSRAARTDATVLVRGETGAGKELIARAVHFNSARRDRSLVKVDCAALPQNLIENELFGHERGAFTSADAASTGKVHEAEGGTLFLDEIGELPLPVQGKLLRLVQERSYLKVGGNRPLQADVRFVCATHRDLEAEVEAGQFRRDLYYRLRVVQITLPSLRERGSDDLDRLIDHFLFEFSRRHGRAGLELTDTARARLHTHPWPGNVRELEHCLESAVVLAPEGLIDVHALALLGPEAPPSTDAVFATAVRPLAEVEADYVRWVLDRCDGNRTAAAQQLGIGRNTLVRKLK